jgi:hypothetical protein
MLVIFAFFVRRMPGPGIGIVAPVLSTQEACSMYTEQSSDESE